MWWVTRRCTSYAANGGGCQLGSQSPSLQFLKQADNGEEQCVSKEPSPWLQDLLGRDIPMSVWALRVPVLAVESRHGLGDLPLILFPTAVHTFFCVVKEGREKGRNGGEAQRSTGWDPSREVTMLPATHPDLTSDKRLGLFWHSQRSVLSEVVCLGYLGLCRLNYGDHGQIQKLLSTFLNLEAPMGKTHVLRSLYSLHFNF